jgi:hypothetical protein
MTDIKNVSYPKVKRMKPDSPIIHLNRAFVTFKADGTNGGVIWTQDNELLTRSRNRLLTGDKDNHGFDEWVSNNIDVEPFRGQFDGVSLVIFGEFIKNDILGRVDYGDEGRFRVFDVFINTVYLDWKDVVDVADKLNLDTVPYETMTNPTYDKCQEYVSNIEDPLAVDDADEEQRIGEGIVIRPPVELKYKNDRRMLYKVKSEKFEEVKKGTNKSSDKKEQQKTDEQKKLDQYITDSRVLSVVESMKEKDPTLEIERQITGEVIQAVQQDIREEADESFDDQVMGSYGGGQIAQRFHKLIDQGQFV